MSIQVVTTLHKSVTNLLLTLCSEHIPLTTNATQVHHTFHGGGGSGRETRYSGVSSVMQLKRVEEDRQKLQDQNRSAAEKTLEKEPSLQAAVQKMVLLTTEARALKEQYDEKSRKLGQWSLQGG